MISQVNYPVAEPRGIFKNQILTAYCHDILYIALLPLPLPHPQHSLQNTHHPKTPPPQSSSLTSGNSLNITLALLLFNILTISPGEYLGGAPRNICTGSAPTAILSISNSYAFAISLNTS